MHFLEKIILINNGSFVCIDSYTDTDEMSVVNAHLNDLPVKFSVCINEGQAKFLRCIGYLSFTKDHIKLDLLQIPALVLLLNFINY